MTRSRLMFVLFVVLLCLVATAAADTRWIKIDGSITSRAPQVVVTENDANHFTFRAHIPGFQVRDTVMDGQLFHQVDFERAGRHAMPGDPAVPVLSRYIAVPDGAVAQVKVTAGAARTINDVYCVPVQAPAADCYGEPEPEFTINDAIYGNDAFFPGKLYDIEGPFVVRGLKMILLRLYPVQVNPVTQQAQVLPDLAVEVTFQGSKGKFFSDRRGLAFQKLYDLAANRMAYRNEPAPQMTGKSPTGAEYIILTAPHLAGPAADLAEWKTLQGYDTEVYTTDDSGTSIAAIKSWVQNAYDTWDPAPEFILFLGDAEFISPTYDNPSIGSDLYYVTVDGDDEWADISHGRISVDTEAEAQKRVDDIIGYERYPITDTNFYTNAYFAAYFQHSGGGYAERRFARTSEETYQWFNQYMPNSPFTPHRIYFTESYVDPRYWNQSTYQWTPTWWTYGDLNVPPEILRANGFAWNGGAADITAAVNGGTAFITHRDHGDTDSWAEPAFSAAQSLALTNGDKLPVVWSINCLTGYFDEETDKSGGNKDTNRFTEAWERNPNGGAVGLIGSTRVSYSGRNDRLFWGWLDAMWPDYEPEYPDGAPNEPEWRMGLVLDWGKRYMDFHYATDPYRMIALEEFHWFGDPTMQMWAGVPQTMTISYLPVVPVGAMSFDVEVNAAGALVSLVQNGVILGKALSSGGTAHVEFDGPVTDLEDIHLTVTRRNYRPHEEDIMVGATQDGLIGLNRNAYSETDTVSLTLSDSDLIDLGTYNLTITSTTESGGETVTLDEIIINKAGTGTFLGTIDLTTAAPSGDGLLSVSDGDDIVVTYYDENNGGGVGEEKSDSAYADCDPPTFGGINDIDAGDSIVELGWSAASDLTPPITYSIYRAETSGGQSFGTPNGTTTETMFTDTGLQNFVTYYYVVRATDAFGHQDTNTVELSDETVGPVVVWEEDFDDKAGIPDTWEVIDNIGACTWSDQNPGGRSSSYWSGSFIIGDAEDCGTFTKWDDEIITEEIDLSLFTDTTLVFTHEFENGGGLFPNHAYVHISNNSGETWNKLVDWKDDRDGIEELDISEWADNQSHIKIKFRYTTGTSGEFWGLDNLEIFGTPNTDPPEADFTATPASGQIPLRVVFNPSASGAIDTYSWDFGDGSISTERYAEHIYESAGTFDVTLTVTGPYGQDTILKEDLVDAQCSIPNVEFGADVTEGGAPLTVNFIDTTDVASGCEPVSVEWDFGDGETSTEVDPTHVYQTKGMYSVTLTYSLQGGGTAQDTKVAMIRVVCGLPVAAFSADVTSGEPPLTVNFTDLSQDTEGCEILGWTWWFARSDEDYVVSHEQNPTHVFEELGGYHIKLEVQNIAGTGETTERDFINVTMGDDDDDDDTTDDDAVDDDAVDDDAVDDDATDDDATDDDTDDGIIDGDGDDDDDDDSGCGC